MLLRIGRAVGTAVLGMALIGLVYLRFFASAPTSRDAWPTEGYYFAGSQYQFALQSLSLVVAQVHLSPDRDTRARRRQEAIALRDLVHAKYVVLVESPDLTPYFEQVQGFREAVGPLRQLNTDLDRLVDDGMSSPAGFQRFDATISPLSPLIASLVNDLRVAELSAFESAFEAQSRAAKAYQEVGLALIGVIGLGLLVHVQYLRKQRRALQQEAQARAEAQRTAQARAALLGMVSHELRTPLQTMLADVEMLSLLPHDYGIFETVISLERAITLVTGRLDNIAQYTRLASGTFELRREAFDVGKLLGRAAAEHANAAAANEQSLQVVIEGDRQIVVEGDPIRLQQVINNFLSNAVKYAGTGSIVLRARSFDRPLRDGVVIPSIEVRVENQGSVIPSADQKTIWEPFIRGKRSAKGREKGSGLGLAVVKLLAASAGWDVGVESNPHSGTAFFVRLPMVGSTRSSAADGSAQP